GRAGAGRLGGESLGEGELRLGLGGHFGVGALTGPRLFGAGRGFSAGLLAAWPLERRSGSPFSESSTAIQRVPGNWARMTIIITVSGVERNMPATPQMAPQKARASRTTTGSMFRLSP